MKVVDAEDRPRSEGRRTIHRGELDSDDVQRLVALHFAQLQAASPADACHVLPAGALRDPRVTFWSLREDGNLLAIGAMKALSRRHGELKSSFRDRSDCQSCHPCFPSQHVTIDC